MQAKATTQSYNTKQRAVILDCLRENRGRHVTVKEILDFLQEKGGSVGQTTVYRYLEKLCREGLVRKFRGAEQGSCCFQYAERGEDCHAHYHLQCLHCGTLFHLECAHLDRLATHVSKDHQFQLDPFQTVFYGCCKDCSGKEAAHE